MRDLNGKRVLAEGARVLLGDINAEGVEAVAKEIDAPWVAFDLVSDQSVNEMVNAAHTEIGGLDGVANVAADLSKRPMSANGDVVETDIAAWQHILNAT